MTILAEVKAANPTWFSRGNKRFFADVSYRVLYGKKSGERFLVRSTYAWTGMLGQSRSKYLHYRINLIGENLEIGGLTEEVFASLSAVKRWLAWH